MRRTLGLLFAMLALTATATSASAASSTKCGDISKKVGDVRATNVSCARAKHLVKTYVDGGKNLGFSCTFKAAEASGSYTCTKAPDKKVYWAFAD